VTNSGVSLKFGCRSYRLFSVTIMNSKQKYKGRRQNCRCWLCPSLNIALSCSSFSGYYATSHLDESCNLISLIFPLGQSSLQPHALCRKFLAKITTVVLCLMKYQLAEVWLHWGSWKSWKPGQYIQDSILCCSFHAFHAL